MLLLIRHRRIPPGHRVLWADSEDRAVRIRPRTSISDGKQTPGARHSLQLLLSFVAELDAGADHKVLDRLGHQDFCNAGLTAHSGGDMDGESAKIQSANFTFAGVDAGPDVDPHSLRGSDYRDRAPDSPCRTIEGCDEPVACRVHLPAAMALKHPGHSRTLTTALRLMHMLRRWAMVEVFMLAVLVSVVKLTALADVVPGVGLWSLGAYVLVTAAAHASFDARDYWSRVRSRA